MFSNHIKLTSTITKTLIPIFDKSKKKNIIKIIPVTIQEST